MRYIGSLGKVAGFLYDSENEALEKLTKGLKIVYSFWRNISVKSHHRGDEEEEGKLLWFFEYETKNGWKKNRHPYLSGLYLYEVGTGFLLVVSIEDDFRNLALVDALKRLE